MAKTTLAGPRKRHSARRTASAARPLPAAETAPVAFRAIPAEGRHLLAVAAGVECETARREAADLEDAVRRLLDNSVEHGADGSAVYLCAFALEAAAALRESIT
jgi:hypothetical protein